eukprot:scaffold32_cov144-Skeletonema_menzelii.AAC.9
MQEAGSTPNPPPPARDKIFALVARGWDSGGDIMCLSILAGADDKRSKRSTEASRWKVAENIEV